MISLFKRRAAPRCSSVVYALTVSAFLAASCLAQEADAAHKHVPPATLLSELLKEAEQNSPQIRAAQQGTQAAKEIPAQVSALPDPTFQLQQVNVVSPRPFAGYTNSEFAYVGLGASQDIPYPGKLKLKGEIAKREAEIAGSHADSVSLVALAEIKTAYYQLAYLSQTLDILNNDQQLLRQVQTSRPDSFHLLQAGRWCQLREAVSA